MLLFRAFLFLVNIVKLGLIALTRISKCFRVWIISLSEVSVGLFLLPLVSAGSCYTALFPCELGFLRLHVGHCPRKIICGDSLRPRVMSCPLKKICAASAGLPRHQQLEPPQIKLPGP